VHFSIPSFVQIPNNWSFWLLLPNHRRYHIPEKVKFFSVNSHTKKRNSK
jgi:hypothetical protein